MRSAVRAAVLLLWAAVMSALVYRVEAPFSAPMSQPNELAAEESDSWQGIYGEDGKIGYAHRRRLVIEDGFELRTEALLNLKMMGAARAVRTEVTARTDRRLQLRDFHFRVSSGAVEFDASGVVTDGALEVRFDSGDRPLRVPLQGPIVLPQTLPEVLASESLETGKTFRYAMFDPMSARQEALELRVGPRITAQLPDGAREVFEVTQTYRGSEFLLWVDPQGEVLRERGPLGLTLLREDRETAISGAFDAGAGLDLVTAAAIPAGREIPAPRERSQVSLRLSGLPDGQSVDFPPRQTLEGGLLRIRRETEDSFGTFVLPASETRFAADLEATPFLQTDDPRIRDRAREILAGQSDARAAARALLDWVFETVAKVPTVSVPNALDVLESKAGDCNEHAVLYAALARAAGLPSRIVAGTVYMPPEETGGAGAFYYHAWVEVWLGGWTAVDPTFGQFPADATHVKLLEGGPETHASLLNLIGRLGIQVEDYG